MIPEAHISHRMERRFRIKLPTKKGDTRFFSNLREQVSRWPGVEEITVNPQLGSALILYKGNIGTLFESAKKNELFQINKNKPQKSTIFENVAATFQGYNKSLRQITNGELDIPSLVFLSLVISGIWQIARGNVAMPAWYTAFYYALAVFSRTNVDEPDQGEQLVQEAGDLDFED